MSARPPRELIALFDEEAEAIRQLLKPGSRRRVEARARLRAMAIIEGSIEGDPLQPGDGELDKLLKRLGSGEGLNGVFPGLAALRFDTSGSGPAVNLRITKTQGIPITLVKEGEAGAVAVAVKRVDELGYYALGLRDLAAKVGLSPNKTIAVIRHLRMQVNPELFKEIRIGQTIFKRYSAKAAEELKRNLSVLDLDRVWEESGPKGRRRRRTPVPIHPDVARS